MKSDFRGEECSAGGNAAACNPAERGTIQTEAETADPPVDSQDLKNNSYRRIERSSPFIIKTTNCAITILNVSYRVLSQIIFRHLSSKMIKFVGNYTASFIDGRSTMGLISIIRQIIKKCCEDLNGFPLWTRNMDHVGPQENPEALRVFRAMWAKDDLWRGWKEFLEESRMDRKENREESRIIP